MMGREDRPANIRNKEFWTDYHKSVLGQIDKINNLLKDLWAASEKPATQTTEKVNLQNL